MKLLKPSLIAVVVGIAAVTCKKSSGNQQAGPAITIQGFMLVDFNGNLTGWNGTPDSDWMIRPHLSAAELALFQFNTNLSLDNTAETIVQQYPAFAFPNPAWLQQRFLVNTQDSNVVKVVYVDSMLRVLKDTALKVKGQTYIGLDLGDTTLFPNHSSRRVYFSFSAAGHTDYAVGYGDVRICNQLDAGNCF